MPLTIEETIYLIKNPVRGLLNYSEGAIMAILEAGKLNPYLTQNILWNAFNWAKDNQKTLITGSDVLTICKRVSEVTK